ncbi:DUF4136 domain-containing protein [Algoriphagus sp. D3-2-R+10]|uniref:DUF4136 domain-containing protein n=1 Tax=Algoriphagus aurantiacus TaxID=3103948 RepID=UPI002B3DF5CF|nr:DUF4136 domain-containing protein [Algoriphagus sp. D3-2-R+10]MEB2775785.1 DUF4136 domain-containing protein [Algoriphagus sp. D3-2-R+10]
MNRIRPNHFFFITFLLLGLSSCSAIEIFKENTEVPIRRPYKSFVIINQEVGMRTFSSQFIDQQVQIHLQEALEEQGLVYDKTEPELIIRYTSNEDPRKRETYQNTTPYPFWGYRVWDPWMYNPYRNNNPTTTNYELVQVIVDFIDQTEDKLLMTLTGVTEVSSQKTKSKKVLKTTDKIIEYFLYEMKDTQ